MAADVRVLKYISYRISTLRQLRDDRDSRAHTIVLSKGYLPKIQQARVYSSIITRQRRHQRRRRVILTHNHCRRKEYRPRKGGHFEFGPDWDRINRGPDPNLALEHFSNEINVHSFLGVFRQKLESLVTTKNHNTY